METNPCAVRIKIINDNIEREVNNSLREQNLTAVQVRVLFLLQCAQDRTMSLKEVERHLHVSQPTAAGVVSRLEQKEYVISMTCEEDRRIKLLQLVLGGANVLLLDEPTNHFDIASCEVLERALEAFGGTILIVTHDRYLVERMADRVVLLEKDGFVEPEEDEGSVFDRLMVRPVQKQEKQPQDNKNNYYLRQKEYKAALAAAKQEICKTERAIEENERAQAQTEADIEKAEGRGDFEGMQRLCIALGQLQNEESLLYEALERAENERAQLEKEGEA